MNKSPTTRLSAVLPRHALLIALALVMSYPLLWMVASSFKPEQLIFSEPGLVPPLHRVELRRGWTKVGVPFAVFMLNSVTICVLCILGNLFSCTLAAYAFARLDFPFSRIAFAIMLGTIMLPFHVTVLPQYIMFQKLGAVNTIIPLVLPKFFAVDAFFIFLLVQFIRGIPRELDAAAEIDGANRYQTFWYVIFPLCKPALVIVAVFTFLWTWNDFFSQLIYLTRTENYTAALALNLFRRDQRRIRLGHALRHVGHHPRPIFLLFVLFQKQLADGIATTGLKSETGRLRPQPITKEDRL